MHIPVIFFVGKEAIIMMYAEIKDKSISKGNDSLALQRYFELP